MQQDSKQQEHGHAAHAQHHEHRHMAFADAEKAAVKFNSPTRDEWQKPEEIVAALDLQAGETIADIGAGTGYLVAHLSKAVGKSGTVIAIDAEDAMIEYLASRVEALGPATVIPHKVRPDGPKLADASVDAIVILDTWHHIEARPEYAKTLFAALRTGGRLVIVDSPLEAEIGPPAQMRISPEQVMQELSAAGFQVRIADESMPRHYLVVAGKG